MYPTKSYPSYWRALDARQPGEALYRLDSGNAGENDVLVATTREEAVRDVLHHHDLEKLPAKWTVTELPGTRRE